MLLAEKSAGSIAFRGTRLARAGGTCGATLAAGANCTITVTFSPTTTGARTGTVTITANVPVTGSPVGLTGTGVAPVVAATLAPATWTTSATRGCTLLGATACPAQIFTLTNTGNVTLTGITQGTISGINAADFPVVGLLSTCGSIQTTLAPGAACAITVRFAPPTTDTASPPAKAGNRELARSRTGAHRRDAPGET